MTENINLNKKTDFKSSKSLIDENKQWNKDNQAWWDWYVSLADNSNSKTKQVLLELPEPPNVKDASKINLKDLKFCQNSPYQGYKRIYGVKYEI